MKEAIVTAEAAPPGGPYSHAVVAGSLVFLAGSTPHLPDGTRVDGPFAEQAERAFENLKQIACAADATLAQAVKVTVYLRDMTDFDEMNGFFARYFGAENAPVRTTIPTPGLAFDIEIDAILHTP